MDSSWLIGLVAWAAFTAGLSAGLLAFASLEARKTRYKKYPASLSDFEEDSEHFEEEPYLSDIYETMPDEYKIKDEKKMKKEAHADSITDSMKETSSILSYLKKTQQLMIMLYKWLSLYHQKKHMTIIIQIISSCLKLSQERFL